MSTHVWAHCKTKQLNAHFQVLQWGDWSNRTRRPKLPSWKSVCNHWWVLMWHAQLLHNVHQLKKNKTCMLTFGNWPKSHFHAEALWRAMSFWHKMHLIQRFLDHPPNDLCFWCNAMLQFWQTAQRCAHFGEHPWTLNWTSFWLLFDKSDCNFNCQLFLGSDAHTSMTLLSLDSLFWWNSRHCWFGAFVMHFIADDHSAGHNKICTVASDPHFQQNKQCCASNFCTQAECELPLTMICWPSLLQKCSPTVTVAIWFWIQKHVKQQRLVHWSEIQCFVCDVWIWGKEIKKPFFVVGIVILPMRHHLDTPCMCWNLLWLFLLGRLFIRFTTVTWSPRDTSPCKSDIKDTHANQCCEQQWCLQWQRFHSTSVHFYVQYSSTSAYLHASEESELRSTRSLFPQRRLRRNRFFFFHCNFVLTVFAYAPPYR